jgi:hypothetical protein
VLLIALGGLFWVGYRVGDDSSEVANLEDEVGDLRSELEGAENEASHNAGEVEYLQGSNEELESQLHAERSLNGKTTVAQSSEFETEFDWETAGAVGYLTIKPTDLSQNGDRWLLTVEAKNEGSEPKTPFCGDAGATLVDAAERTYTGESVIATGSDACTDLQPGLTGTFKSEFTLPPDAEPVVAAIYGDYELEEEAKTWALPE